MGLAHDNLHRNHLDLTKFGKKTPTLKSERWAEMIGVVPQTEMSWRWEGMVVG